MIKTAILGAAGRMGAILLRHASRLPDFQIAAAVDPAPAALGKDAGALAGLGPIGVAISTDAGAAMAISDVSIDFSAPAASVAHAEAAARLRKPLVIGTTGLSAEQAGALRSAARETAIVWAPNMSLGVNLLFDIVERVAKTLQGYDIEIIETHHRRKKDAPSGTALGLASAAARGAGLDAQGCVVHGRSGMTGERPAGQIGIHAVRAGDVVGEHTVLFATEGERVELTHKASGRETFAAGAFKAAQWLAEGRAAGLYDMRDVLGLR